MKISIYYNEKSNDMILATKDSTWTDYSIYDLEGAFGSKYYGCPYTDFKDDYTFIGFL